MSLYNACKEVLEAILLFMGQQYGHLSTTSAKQLKPRAWVSVTAVPCPDRAVRDAAEVTWQVRVEASGLGAYYLDGVAFLNTLCDFGDSLRCTISKQERKGLAVYSRRIGEFSTVQCHTICSSSSSASRPVEETVLTRPQDFQPAGLRVCFEARCTTDVAMLQVQRLSSHMHLLHIINPEVELRLSMMNSSHTLLALHYTQEPSRAPLPSSPYRIITCLHHYLSTPTRHKNLHLVRGSSYTLPPLALKDGASLSLKLYCTVAVVPHFSLHKGKKIPANRTCRNLHVSVFGPGTVPLLAAGSPHALPLPCLADWESYGLNLGQSSTHLEQGSGTVVPACCCQLSNSRPASGSHPDRPSRVSQEHTLLLFMFLEDVSAGRGGVSCPNARWRQQMEQIQEVRGTLSRLIHSHQRKFRQAVHSALNKLICNYGTHFKTATVMRTAFPMVADAVSSIVRHSTSNQFQKTCCSILNVQRTEDIQKCIARKLWEIAEKKLHISESQTNFPHEPNSPELEQASSDCTISSKKDTVEKRTREPGDTTVQPSSFTATAGDVPVSIPPISTVSEPVSQSHKSKDINRRTSAGAQSCSLFQAMIHSRRKRSSDSQPTRTDQPLPSTEPRGERGPPAVGGAGGGNACGALTETGEGEDSLLLEEDSVSLLSSCLPPKSSCVPNSGAVLAASTSFGHCVASQRSADSFFEELEAVDMEQEESAALGSAMQPGLSNCVEGSGGERQSVWSEMEWEESDGGFDDLEQFSEFSAPEDSDFDTVCLSSDEGEGLEEEGKHGREGWREREEAEEDEEEWWTGTESALESLPVCRRTSEIGYWLNRAPPTAGVRSSSGGGGGMTECPSDEEWTAAMESTSGVTTLRHHCISDYESEAEGTPANELHSNTKETGKDEWLLWEEVEDNVCPAMKASPLTYSLYSSHACTLARDTPPLVPDICGGFTTDVDDTDFQWD